MSDDERDLTAKPNPTDPIGWAGRFARYATIGVFALMMLAPIGAFVLFGFGDRAQRVETAKPFRFDAFFAHSDGYRTRYLRELITGSELGNEAVQLRYALDRTVVDDVDNNSLVSGRDGWLFTKDQFDGGRCPSRQDNDAMLAQIEALQSVAAGAGIDLIFAIAPDKSVAYPGKLGRLAAAYAGCKNESAMQWRAMAQQEGVPIIDHLQALGIDRMPSRFYRTDTHWNSFGAAIAFGQLRAALYHEPYVPPQTQPVPGGSAVRDLMRLVLLAEEEPDSVLDDPRFWSLDHYPPLPGRTLSVHDSFYELFFELPDLFQDYDSLAFYNSDPTLFSAVVNDPPQRIIVSSVERLLQRRLVEPGGDLDWTRGFGLGLLALNGARTDECRFETQSTEFSKSYFAGSGEPIAIPLPQEQPDSQPCLRVTIGTDATGLSVLDVPRREAAGTFSVRFGGLEGESERRFALTLPPDMAGKTLRLTPLEGLGTVEDVTIETGTRPRIEVFDHQPSTSERNLPPDPSFGSLPPFSGDGQLAQSRNGEDENGSAAR